MGFAISGLSYFFYLCFDFSISLTSYKKWCKYEDQFQSLSISSDTYRGS